MDKVIIDKEVIGHLVELLEKYEEHHESHWEYKPEHQHLIISARRLFTRLYEGEKIYGYCKGDRK